MNIERKHVFTASFVALVAWGLAARSFPILPVLAYAFWGGVLVAIVLFGLAITTTSTHDHTVSRDAYTTPAFLTPSKWRPSKDQYHALQEYEASRPYPESFVVSSAIDTLLGLALRDFVSSWYSKISSSPAFVNEVDKNIRVALDGIRERLLKEDIVNVIVLKIIPIITSHLREFDNAERSVRGRAGNRNVTESEELNITIAGKYNEGRLHPAASLAFSDTKSIQQEHLRKILVRLLPDLLPENMVRSRAVLVLVKEIVSCAVLYPIVQMLIDPDTWNQIIEAYGRTVLQDRRTVRRMRAALDEHTSPAKSHTPLEIPRLSPNDNERAFERFVRAIRKTRNLADARRFRSQIASQLAKESMVDGQDPIYLRRLEMGKRVLEQKISKLAKAENGGVSELGSADAKSNSNMKLREFSLVEIMHTASGLSYFMEFMDRQKKMSLVQFWIVVDGFRNPLEDDFGDERTSATITWTNTDRLDIAQIAETYVSKPEMNVSSESQDTIREFLVAGRKATPEQYRAARVAILAAQSAILDDLDRKYFPSFRKSDLYYKFLASDEAAIKTRNPSVGFDGARAHSPTPSKISLHTPPTTRSNSQVGPIKARDLRRAALSSSDVKSLAFTKSNDSSTISRRSLDADYKPLFDDDYDSDSLAQSTQSLGRDSINGDMNQPSEVIENMEAALTDIMTQGPHGDDSETERDALFGSPVQESKELKPSETPRTSLDMGSSEFIMPEKSKPSLSTLGLVNTASRIGVFADNDLFPDEEKFIEDEYADHEDSRIKTVEDEIHEAAPGDLGLAEAITALSNDIERLTSQEAVVDALTRKAELTNNIAELRILSKSKSSLQREIRRKELQRQQYIVQESDNSLYGRSTVKIKSIMVGKEDDGKEFAMYVIEVQRQAGDQMPAASWAIARRYSEFHDLHSKLRRRYPSTRNLEFPRRRVVMKLQKQFLHNRRVALEAYLQQLLRMPDVCRSRELRSFLSQQAISPRSEAGNLTDPTDLVSRIYNSVTDGMDEFLGNVAVLDQLSVAGQNLISAATTQMGMSQSEIINIETGSVAEAEAELRAFEDKELEPFVKPICDIFLETFELNRGNNWLRGRAVVVVLHQLLGGTVERKVRDLFHSLFTEDSLLRYLDLAKETMWPGGKMRETRTRTASEKSKTKQEAAAILATLIPDTAGSVVGRANAQAAAKRICATLNNARLNQHLVLCVLDEIVGVLFDRPSARRLGVA